MPSLWDLLCVSRQKYATDGETKQRPHRKWDDPPYYHAPRTEYYIQPDVRLTRPPGPGSVSSSLHYGNRHSPRSPQYRGGFFSQDPYRQNAYSPHSPYVFSGHSGPQSPPSTGDFIDRDRHDVGLLNNRQNPRAEPIQSGGYMLDNHSDELEEERISSGKRRHVRDIFAHVTTQSDDSQDIKYQPMSASSSYVTSSVSSHNQPPRRTEPRPPGHRQTSESAQASGKGQGTGGSAQAFLPTQNPDLGQSPRSKQISGFTQPTESGHILTSLGFSPVAGPRPNKAKQAENMAQYSPRTVSDNAISAALFGNRLDDFVHDPGWNQAIDKFAASPASPSAFSFGDKSVSPSPNKFMSSPQLISPAEFEGNVVFKVSPDSSDVTNHNTRQSDSSEAPSKVQERTINTSPVYKSGFILMDSERTAHESPGSGTMEVDNTDVHPVSPGSDVDIETFFTESGDVLY